MPSRRSSKARRGGPHSPGSTMTSVVPPTNMSTPGPFSSTRMFNACSPMSFGGTRRQLNLTGGTTHGGTSRMTQFKNSTMGNTVGVKPHNEDPFSTYNAATRLYMTFSNRRKVLEKAAAMTHQMNNEVRDIATTEEQSRIQALTDKLRHDEERGGLPQEEGSSEDGDAASESHQSGTSAGLGGTDDLHFGDDGDDRGIGVPRTDEEIIETSIRVKCDRVNKLRELQRTIAEFDALAAEEERQKREIKRVTAHVESSPDDEVLRDRQQTAVERLRDDFNSLFKEAETTDIPPPPPQNFTSTALAVTLEYLGRSIGRIISMTDEVCVAAIFRHKDEVVTLSCMSDLRKHLDYSRGCYEVMMGHLAHFELGQKAMLDGAAFEVNSLREQFLMHKEAQTALEVKQKTAEEQRNALQTRLQMLTTRCDMWESLFFNRSVQHGADVEGEDEIVPVDGVTPPTDGNEAVENAPSVSPKVSIALNDTSTVYDRLKDYFPSSRGGGDSLSVRLHRSSDGGLSPEDEMELRVSKAWGNPYVTKATLYEQACLNNSRFSSRKRHNSSTSISQEDSINFHQIAGGTSGMESNDPNMNSISPRSAQRFSVWTKESSQQLGGTGRSEQSFANPIAETRAQSLLQALLRGIPVKAHKDISSPQLSSSKQTLRSSCVIGKSLSDAQRRGETRQCIQRLIRYLASRSKPGESTTAAL